MNNYIKKLRSRYTAKKFDPNRTLSKEQIRAVREMLQLTPSSTNTQPWHFFLALSPEGKEKVAASAVGPYEYNRPKIINSGMTVVLCSMTDIDKAYTDAIVAQEERDGRYPSRELREANREGREFFVDLHRQNEDVSCYLENQTFIALGNLLVGAEFLGINACPIGGFDPKILSQQLELKEKGLAPSVLVALGYSAENDFNATTPKSRFPQEQLFTTL